LSTIRKANQIIVLKTGEIVETGTHNELMTKQGLFESLHKMQFGKQQNVSEVI
jgi:ABC-type multidrug transport system fused ATPase/permease subunit